MKKILIVLCCIIFVIVSIFAVKFNEYKTTSTENTSGYAVVKTLDTYLFSNASEQNKMFLLEQSYFVKVLEDFNDNYYKVEYLDYTGYVLKSKIDFVSEFPENPYLVGITFDISTSNVCLRSSPTTINGDNNILCVIPKNSVNLLYIGKIAGEESSAGLGNLWYYCKYTIENQTFSGYVYSPLAINLSAINKNGENLTTVNISNFVPINSLLYLSLSTRNIMLIVIALPTIFFLVLLVKPANVLDKQK